MASSNVLTITESNFDAEVLKSNVPVLGPVIDEIADAKAGQAKVGKVNVDDCQSLAARYRINSIPALLFFKNGEVVDQTVGAAPKATLSSKLDALL